MARKTEELIKRNQKVGEGGFGTVYIGSYGDYKEVGIKDIKGKLSDEALTEANILKNLTHRNIIRYIDIVQTRYQTSLIMEFIDGGSLYDYIQRTAQSSAYWRTSRQIMLDVAHGMTYLYSQRVVHADLKSLNVLLRHNYDAVICDFGLARAMVDSKVVLTSQASGTERWFAPELCFDRPERSSFESDVWAFGCVLLEIISKKIPWVDSYPSSNQVFINALAKSENAIIFENICLTQRAPERLRTLLCDCCSWKKADRSKFSEIVRDLSSISDIDLQNINEGKEKSTTKSSSNPRPRTSNKRAPNKPAASLPIKIDDSDLFDSVLNSMTEITLENSNPQRKPTAKCKKNDPKNQSTNEGETKYDPVLNRYLLKGPRGGWYYIDSNGNKKYPKTDTV